MFGGVPYAVVGATTNKAGTKKQGSQNTCWAACFAFITNKEEVDFKLYTKLDASVSGLQDEDEADLLKAATEAAGENKFRKFEPWTLVFAEGQNRGLYFPLAVALPHHYVVVTAAWGNPSFTKIFQIRYWDPADNTFRDVTPAKFDELKPAYAYSPLR